VNIPDTTPTPVLTPGTRVEVATVRVADEKPGTPLSGTVRDSILTRQSRRFVTVDLDGRGRIDADLTAVTILDEPAKPTRCTIHPAYEADYCPPCGTTTLIGDR
jgi:hypothetical protein